MRADFTIKTDDRKRPIQITCKRNGAAVDLSASGVSYKFIMTPVNTTTPKVNAAASDADEANGVVQYAWAAGDTDTAGWYKAEVEVTWDDGKKETFPNKRFFYIQIISGLG